MRLPSILRRARAVFRNAQSGARRVSRRWRYPRLVPGTIEEQHQGARRRSSPQGAAGARSVHAPVLTGDPSFVPVIEATISGRVICKERTTDRRCTSAALTVSEWALALASVLALALASVLVLGPATELA